MTTDFDSDDSPLLVNLSDIETQLFDHLTAYLRGRTDLQTLFTRVAPLFEESQSPRAERIVLLCGAYANGMITKGRLDRELTMCNEFLRGH